MCCEEQPAEEPAPEKGPSGPGVTDDPEQRNEREESQEPEREWRERKAAETDGRDGRNQGSSDVRGTSQRADVDW